MKYSVETNGNSYTETLEVDGREYTKKWVKSEYGMICPDHYFAEQLEANGVYEEFVEEVREKIDDSFFAYDFYEIFKGGRNED